MTTELTSILSDGLGLADCVNLEALYQSTTRRPLTDIIRIEWQTIRELHILGADSAAMRFGGPEAGCYIDQTGAWALVIAANSSQIDTIINRCGIRLRVLDLRFAQMQKLSLRDRLGSLETLRLSPMERLAEIEGLSALTKLRELDISFAAIGSHIDLTGMHELVRLELAGNTELAQIDGLTRMSQLEELDLSGTAIGKDLDLSVFGKLKRLRLVDTQKLERVFGLGSNPELTHVDLSCSGIRRVPDDARELTKLVHLDLSNLELEELPDWLPELNLNFTYRDDGINLRGTSVPGLLMRLFERKISQEEFTAYQEDVRQWFEDRKKETAKPINELKVVFLGDGGVGKSPIIGRLLRDGAQTEENLMSAKPGISIHSKRFDIGDRSVNLHFWDFGGQEIIHSTYRMFMTRRTLYVVVVDVRFGNQDDRARYWLHTIRSFAEDAPVLMVLNGMDLNPSASVNEAALRAIHPQLREILKISVRKDSKEVFEQTLMSAIERQVDSLEHVAALFPPAWSRLKDNLRNMNAAYIRNEEFQTLCDQHGIQKEPKVRGELLRWLGDLGIGTNIGKLDQPHERIVLHPNWLSNAITRLIANRDRLFQGGRVTDEALSRVLQPSEGNDAWGVYDIEDWHCVLTFMRRARISFVMDDQIIFVPMLCSFDAPAAAKEYVDDIEAVEFRMEYEYLPADVIHQLMAARRNELDMDNVWFTGARFVLADTGLSAVVMIKGDLLRIIVRSENASAIAQSYVDMLTDDLTRINDRLGLKISARKIAYKAAGMVEYFDYDELLLAQELNDTHVSSAKRRMKIPIAAILMQTSSKEQDRKKKLIQDIYWSCTMLQSNRIFFEAAENDRTTFIRDLLRAKGYIVSDHTLSGVSLSGMSSGELDLDIRMEPNIPWTICETFNIRGKGGSGLRYWEQHLQKILVNYNPNGLPFMFLITYVGCPKERFDNLMHLYWDHMQNHYPEGHTIRSVERMRTAADGYGENAFIRLYRAVYDRGGSPVTVYQFFVRLGE